LLNRMISGIMLGLLLASVLATSFIVRVGRAKTRIITVPDDYQTIQEAINNANEGERIYVRAGTYGEHIDLNKSLTLEGESNENTILNVQRGVLFDFGIWIIASNVVIRNFRITSDSTFGRVLLCADGRNNVVSSNVIRDNVLINNDDSIVTVDSSNNQVLNNTVINVPRRGACIACLGESDYNVISNNTVIGGWTGIVLDGPSSMNYVSCNIVKNQIPESGDVSGALSVSHASNNVFVGNTVTDNAIGICLRNDDSNTTVYHNNFQQYYPSIY
jgi:nitrous oxidase accessory protein